MPTLELQKFDTETGDLVTAATEMEVADTGTLERAYAFLKTVLVPLRKEIKSTFGPIKTKAHETWKETVNQEKRYLEPVEEAERIIRKKAGTYELQREQEANERAIAAAKQAKREAEAKRQAQVTEAVVSGDDAAVRQLARMLIAVKAQAQDEPKKFAGVSTRANWKAAPIPGQIMETIRFVAENPQYANFLTYNMPALNSEAKAREALFDIPGVQAVNTPTVSVRG